MALLFFILIAIVCIIISFFVLIQNPKGGGLSGTFGGVGNQFMGVKQTNDVLEKGTWIFISALGVLCIVSVMAFSGSGNSGNENKLLKNLPTTAPASQQNSAPITTPPSAPQK